MPPPESSSAGKAPPKAQAKGKPQAKAQAKAQAKEAEAKAKARAKSLKGKGKSKAAASKEDRPDYTPPKLRRLTVGDCKLTIMSSVKGLVSERELVRAASRTVKPRCLAVGISPGEIDGLRNLAESGDDPPEFFLSQHEILYATGLSFLADKLDDKVKVPPPSFDEAVKLGVEKGIELEGLDLQEVEYTEAYIKHITRWQWLRQGMRLKKLKKKPWASTTPDDFAFEYDDALGALPGYAALERTREQAMADRLIELADDHTRILAVIELPRVDGVIQRLKEARKKKEEKKEEKEEEGEKEKKQDEGKEEEEKGDEEPRMEPEEEGKVSETSTKNPG